MKLANIWLKTWFFGRILNGEHNLGVLNSNEIFKHSKNYFKCMKLAKISLKIWVLA